MHGYVGVCAHGKLAQQHNMMCACVQQSAVGCKQLPRPRRRRGSGAGVAAPAISLHLGDDDRLRSRA